MSLSTFRSVDLDYINVEAAEFVRPISVNMEEMPASTYNPF